MKNLKLKIKKYITTIILVSILLVAAILRLYQLGNVPPSPDWDEAALGYNAYSIIHTGRDEYGKLMPIILQSFDDYKPALYIYFAIPSIVLFDLNTFSVRLSSAIFGILTVLAVYFLVKTLFEYRGTSQNQAEILALLSSFLLAISPWHIQFSRVAFETNIGLAFNIFGALFFLKGLKKHWLLVPAAFLLGLNLSVYHSDRVFAPLLILTLIIIFFKQFFAIPKKYLITSLIVGIFAILPLATYLATNNNTLSRLKGVSIFSERTPQILEAQNNLLDDKNNNNFLGIVMHNKWFSYSQKILSGYFAHFDPNWLFIKGDMPRHHAPGMGLLYLWELPFLLIGIYGLLFFSFPTKTKLLVFTWFLISPIPASITIDTPHAVRTLNFLPTFQIFIAIGLVTVGHQVLKISSLKVIKLLFALYSLLFAFNFFYYLNQYFIQQNYFTSSDWQYGYKETVDFIKTQGYKYKKVIVSDEVPLDQSYIFFLYYLQYPPDLYQQTGNRHAFDKYEFRQIDWEHEKIELNSIYIISSKSLPQNKKILKQINLLNGEPVISIVGT